MTKNERKASYVFVENANTFEAAGNAADPNMTSKILGVIGVFLMGWAVYSVFFSDWQGERWAVARRSTALGTHTVRMILAPGAEPDKLLESRKLNRDHRRPLGQEPSGKCQTNNENTASATSRDTWWKIMQADSPIHPNQTARG